MSDETTAETSGTRRVRKRAFRCSAAYELCLKCSHLFNILDARGAISVTERVGVIARVRALAVGIAKAWVDQQQGAESPNARRLRTEPDESVRSNEREVSLRGSR